ncbi:MAG: RNA polymerase sigma factor, partial [Clostridia bacterium]|nr:RNA polymerase sigma factor [Clostridia bacterium]
MDRKDAERVIEQMTRPVFAFALKRCKTTEDAEDLSQEILLRAYRSLIARDDVEDPEKFTWTVAHNALANYYRDYRGGYVGVMIDDFAETLGVWDEYFKEDDGAAIDRMRREIAYLSKLQRRIVIAYYYEGKKQQEIANELGIPLGTVKWHLFEAKRELKKGMEKMRDTSELKFNPIKFDTVGLNGHAGTGAKNTKDYFRTTLTQNICYCVRNNAKTVEEIADALGVSPVYVEGEVEYLEEMCFLKKQNGKYIVNFLIDEPTSEYLILQNDMYRKTASLFANDLYDELVSGGLLDDPGIICNQTDGAVDLKTPCRTDRNFVLWSLIPFIAGMSGEDLMDETVKSEEVMIIRPDGGCNIVHATVIPDDLSLPDDYVYMKNWCGPMWSEINGITHWQINSEWSERKALDFSLFPE